MVLLRAVGRDPVLTGAYEAGTLPWAVPAHAVEGVCGVAEGSVTLTSASGTFTTTAPFGLTHVDNGAETFIGWGYAPEGVGAGPEGAVITAATQQLTSQISGNQRLVRESRDRFIASRRQMDGVGAGIASRNNVAFDVDPTFALNGTTVSTRGNFFGQTGDYAGTQRRLVFGDFDVQHDSDTGSSTATLTGRIAWEQMVSNDTMLGYFIGGELARSDIEGAYNGDQDRIGVTIGGYAVHQLQDDVFLDGFLTLGAGRNDIEIKNDAQTLESDYNTRTATIGAALSGVYEYEQYEFRPELAVSYGKTWIGNVSFASVDNTISVDAGNVSIANLTLRPEVVWALDADTVADSNSQFSFAPRAICERRSATTRTDDCGGGAELGLSSASSDGLSSAEIRLARDRVGSSYRSSFAVNVQHRF
ncbi:autotransporter outer membrane beta-barrel domain-containing protein [Rhodobacteraceae bacterium XHP0102]|nr:autotransporter outer membrane beta-barrel domain-containing protein [Rhodobacteraceae bacterium XHP0102]